MNTTHTDPDWCLRSKVVCILAWLGIDGKISKSEASRVIRMYNLYKNKMK